MKELVEELDKARGEIAQLKEALEDIAASSIGRSVVGAWMECVTIAKRALGQLPSEEE